MRIAQEPDRVDARVIVIVAVCTVAVIALGVLFARQVRDSVPDVTQAALQSGRWGRPPEEVNAAELTLFSRIRPEPPEVGARPAEARPAAPREHAYAWSDRERGLVRVPLNVAKELYLSGHRASGAIAAGEGGLER